jgi:hypothetical protein
MLNSYSRFTKVLPMRRSGLFLLCMFWMTLATAGPPELLGHGVRSCEEYLASQRGWEKGEAKSIAEYYRYQDWLAGFVSGLNLATGDDQLRGVGVSGVLRRNLIHCREHPEDDFFAATMALIRSLKALP